MTKLDESAVADVCIVITRGISPAYDETGIPVLSQKCIRENRVVLESARITNPLKKKVSPDKLVRINDVLVNSTGVGTLGRVAQVTWVAGEVTVDSHVSIVRPDPGKIDPRFFGYAMVLNQPKIEAMGEGATGQTELSRVRLAQDVFVPRPPLPVQRRIVGILSAYDELIENSQRRIQILEEMARALYREWFVHFRFPGHEKHPRVGSTVGDAPKGWIVKPLESLMVDHIGGGWGKEAADEDHTEPAWVIRGTDIPGARNSRVTDAPHRFHTLSNLRNRRLRAGDIVFEVSGGSKGQPVGRTLFVTRQLLSAFGDDSVICASFCKRIRPDAEGYGAALLYLSFLEGYESGEIEQFQVQSTGIANFKWTQYIAKTIRAVPPPRIRSKFGERVATLFSQIATLGLAIQNLRRTRDLLLPRLLSGQTVVEPEKS